MASRKDGIMSQKSDVEIHNRVIHEITETNSQHPGVFLPKKDKILEWTLYNIYLELKGIRDAAQSIAAQLRMKS